MPLTVALVLVVVFAFLVSRALHRYATNTLILWSLEYVLVGFVVGPIGLGVLEDAQLEVLRRRRIVQDALETLNAAHREAIVLVDLEERTAVEVAAMLGVAVGTLYSRLHHARKAFAAALEPRSAEIRSSLVRGELAGGRR